MFVRLSKLPFMLPPTRRYVTKFTWQRHPAGALISKLHYQNAKNPLSQITTDIRQSTSTVLGHTQNFKTGFRYTDFGETTKLYYTHELIEVAYTGGIWDESTGLYYLKARFYNPVDARFMQIDVARNGGDLRATLSLYGYCEGDLKYGGSEWV